MPTLDFSKLSPPKGETFEGLIRLLGNRLGMLVEWSGRGADGGRDLIFVETLRGPINTRSTRWLVSCKDNSDSNLAVKERDVGSVLDKVKQHKCDGFLLATTTTASTGLKELLDKLDSSEGGPVQTKVWDRFEITRLLLSDEYADLLVHFFPDYARKEAVAKLEDAREVVEAHLPRFAAGQVRTHLVPKKDRQALLTGETIWPHDAEQLDKINELTATLIGSGWRKDRLNRAATGAEDLEFDAFMSFCDALIRNFPSIAIDFLKAVAATSTDGGVIYNAIDMLRESGQVRLNEELSLTKNCDSGTLHELYYERVAEEFRTTIEDRVWEKQLERRSYYYDIEFYSIDVDELDFDRGDDFVLIEARISIIFHASPYDPEGPREKHDHSCKVEAHLEGTGLVIDSIG